MKYEASEERLTPAARQVLDTLAEEYRNEVLLNAEQLAAGYTGEFQEISVHDIVEGASRVKSRVNRLDKSDAASPGSKVERRIQLILRAYRLIGAAIILVASVYIVYLNTGFFFGERQRPVTYLLVAGIFLVILPYFAQQWLSFIRTSRSESSGAVDLTRAYVTRWQEIELASRELVATALGESAAAEHSIADLISLLQKAGIISSADQVRLRELLSLRNEILHKGSAPRESELVAAIRDATKILAKLRSHTGEARL